MKKKDVEDVGKKKHEEPCLASPKCLNCQGDHPSWSPVCAIFKEEKVIQEIKVTKKISYTEAKREIKATNTTPKGPTYAKIAAREVETKEMGTQTPLPPVCSPCKTILTSFIERPAAKAVQTNRSTPAAVKESSSHARLSPPRKTSSQSDIEDISEGELTRQILSFKKKKKGERGKITR